jgi:hypothetical protein
MENKKRGRGRPKKARESQGDLQEPTGTHSRQLTKKVKKVKDLTPVPLPDITTPTLKETVVSCPIEKHPMIVFLAERWEELDDKIAGLRREQLYLENLAQDFRSKRESRAP